MKVLIIGGTGLISQGILKHLHARKARVTMFNRGQRENRVSGDVQVIRGDRNEFDAFERAHKDATYDVVLRDGDVVYPVPWARDASTSFLRSAAETRAAVENAGLQPTLWRDDSQTAIDWFRMTMAGSPPSGANLGVVLGPDFQAMTANLARNILEKRLGVLSAVMIREM